MHGAKSARSRRQVCLGCLFLNFAWGLNSFARETNAMDTNAADSTAAWDSLDKSRIIEDFGHFSTLKVFDETALCGADATSKRTEEYSISKEHLSDLIEASSFYDASLAEPSNFVAQQLLQ